MCSLFYIDDKILKAILLEVSETDITAYQVQTGQDIHPTQKAFVMRKSGKNGICLSGIRWGYPGILKSGVLINARVETVLEKKVFANGIHYHRAVIPASFFYEWNRIKEKSKFRRQDEAPLYLAGFFDMINNEEYFVILTTQANASMQTVHDRMPLILEKNQIRNWIMDEKAAKKILYQVPVELKRQADYEQMTLF